VSRRLTATAAAATIATSVGLYPLIATTAWFWAGAGAVIVTGAAGSLTRLRRLPAVVCLAATLAALLLYLNVIFASARSAGGLIPTVASLHHLWWLAGQGIAEVHHYAPPVPAGHGILLFAAAGIGIIAVATDLIAVRLRRPALAGLPLLTLFCVPLSTTSRPGPVGGALVFALAVAGYLALLSADGRERVRVWGRVVSAWQPRPSDGLPETRKLAAAGRRIGFAAAALAVFIPLLLPGSPARPLLGGSGGQGTGRGAAVYLPNPLAVLNQQLHQSRTQTVLTYRTTDPAPPYLQVYVLGQLTGSAWTLGPDALAGSRPVGASPLPGAPGLNRDTPGPPVHETISLATGLTAASPGISYLPLPYPARSVAISGDWRVVRQSLMVYTLGGGLSGLQYRLTAKDVNPLPGQLRQAPAPPASVAGYTSVPSAYSSLRSLARQVTAGQHTPYGQAVALQQWFTRTGHFRYSLNVAQPRSAQALINFLTTSKRGYCQQFAFAMAVLARLLGIPSRVVIGYTQGSFTGGNNWRVTTHDAHAWPELYFQGAGWLRFEPTPDGSNGPGQGTASPPAYSFGSQPTQVAPSGQTADVPGSTVPGATPTRGSAPGDVRVKSLPQGLAPGGSRDQRGGGPAGWLAAVAAGLLLITPRTLRTLTRRRRWNAAADDAGRAAAAWRELTDDLADHGITGRPSESPRAAGRRLTGILGLGTGEREALGRIVSAAERARYAREPAEASTLRGDVALLRRAMARNSGPAGRCRAWIIPASAVAPLRTAAQQTLDVFGWLDRFTSREGDRAVWGNR
jgi:transglutaminase-like putative cysteine protease